MEPVPLRVLVRRVETAEESPEEITLYVSLKDPNQAVSYSAPMMYGGLHPVTIFKPQERQAADTEIRVRVWIDSSRYDVQAAVEDFEDARKTGRTLALA